MHTTSNHAVPTAVACAAPRIHLVIGPVGAGTTMKLATSLMAFSGALAAFEAMSLTTKAGIDVRIPPIRYCTDNGAMIAALGSALVRRDVRPSDIGIGVDSSMPLGTVFV